MKVKLVCECGGVIAQNHVHWDEHWNRSEMFKCNKCKKYINKKDLLK